MNKIIINDDKGESVVIKLNEGIKFEELKNINGGNGYHFIKMEKDNRESLNEIFMTDFFGFKTLKH